MAKRGGSSLQEEEKRALNSSNIRKFLGIFRYVLPYRWTFMMGLVSLGISSVTLLSFPYFAGTLLDIASGKTVPFFSTINQVALLLIFILFGQGIFSFIRVYTFSVVSEKALADVRQALYQKVIWLPMKFFDNHRVGDLLSRITSDVGTLQETFTTTLAELLRQFLVLICGTTLIFFLTPKLTVFMLLTFPLLIGLALLFGKFIRKLSRHTQEKLAGSNVVVEESLQAIATVKAFTNEMFEQTRYGNSLRHVIRVAIRASLFRGLFISFVIFILFGGIVSITWYGAGLVQSGAISIGELLSFVLYTAFIAGSMAGLGDIYTQLQRSIGASERLLEILGMEDETALQKSEEAKIQGEVEFDHVSFAYPGRPDVQVLKGLTFRIKAGEKVALVGQSGAGKSTVISLLMRFYPVSGGLIRVDGKNVHHYDLSSYRHHLGIVPQEVILFGGTIFDNIAYGKPGASMEEVRDAARKANALEFIEGFPERFKTLVGDRGVKLSGGQRQRIAIARAILKDPAILILDEATSSLDAHSELLVQKALEILMEGRTTIIIAHRLSTIKKADRIFVIKNGVLAETGTPQELSTLDDGIFQDLLKLQIQ